MNSKSLVDLIDPIRNIQPCRRRHPFRKTCASRSTGLPDNPNLPYAQRRKLLKIEITGRCQLLKNEMDARIRIEQGRLAKSEAVALAAISAYGDKLIYQIRDEFTKTLRKCRAARKRRTTPAACRLW